VKKDQLKKALKPIIHECIKEALYEEGLLKNIVSQVVEGYSRSAPRITERAPTPAVRSEPPDAEAKKVRVKLDETKRQMLSAIGQDAYGGVNVFEGTTPMRGAEPAAGNIMEGVAPEDPGVDISQLFNNRWGKLI